MGFECEGKLCSRGDNPVDNVDKPHKTRIFMEKPG